jgi:signal transduction histidine kinase
MTARRDPGRSLRATLLRLIHTVTLTAVSLALFVMVAYDLQRHRRDWINDLTTQAELLGLTSAAALAFDDSAAAKENLALLHYRPRMLLGAIYDERGNIFASYVREGYGGSPPELPGTDGIRVDGSDFVGFRRIEHDGQIVGTVHLRARHELDKVLLNYLGIAAVVAGLSMATAFLLARRLERVVTGPILTVAKVAEDVVALADYSRRAPKVSDDEVGALTESFNSMLEEVERRESELANSNRELAIEIEAKNAAQNEVLRLNAELEEIVRQRTAELMNAVHELESFSYSVSHDLRAPLRAINGFSQALVADHGADLPPQAQRYLSRITAATTRMEQLIEDLLNLSRVSRGDLTRVPVDVSAIARQIAASLQSAEPARAVEFSIWNGLQAVGDPRLLRTALENLIGNAWKFTSKTAAAKIDVGSMRDGERQVFYVRDNGAGFDMKYADKLFGAFQRLHTVDEFPGTGIGLATVARVVARHGGRVWADGREGEGAAFYFTIDEGTADAGARGDET